MRKHHTLRIVPLLILFLCCASCHSKDPLFQPSSLPANGLSISLKPNQPTIPSEKVPQGAASFTATIKNNGTTPALVAHPSVCMPHNLQAGQFWHLDDSHGKSEILLEITKPDGEPLVLRDGHHFFDLEGLDHLIIPPGKTSSFHVGWFFLNARGRWEDDQKAATAFEAKGVYKVRILFRNSFPKAIVYEQPDPPKVKTVDAWTGEICSEPTTVEIQ